MSENRRLAELLQDSMRRHNVTGAALALIKDGVLSSATGGTVNIDTGYPVLPKTWFAAGSVTKVFTATLVMMLVDQGAVDLDAPVATYIEDFALADRDASQLVTVRMLLNHTSGLPGNFMLDLPKSPEMVQQQVARLATFDFNSRPGELWSYSNAGLATLGRIVEVVTKQTWDAALTSMLLKPAGIKGSSITEEMMLHSVAVGHNVDPTTGATTRTDRFQIDTCNGPTGATLWCDVEGLAAFGQLHLNGGRSSEGEQLLSVHSVAEMQREQAGVPWAVGVDKWGLGWSIRYSNGHTVLSHTGANAGAHSTLIVLPEQQGVIALMANSSSGVALTTELGALLLSEDFDVLAPEAPQAPGSPPTVDVTPYLGSYVADDAAAEVSVRDGALVVEQINSPELSRELLSMGFAPPVPVELTAYAPDGRFVAASGMPISFVTPQWSERPEYMYIGRVFRRVA